MKPEVEFCHRHHAFCWKDSRARYAPKHGGIYFMLGLELYEVPALLYPEELGHQFCDHGKPRHHGNCEITHLGQYELVGGDWGQR